MSACDDLERLLNTDPQTVLQQERTAFDQIAAPFETSIVLFGAGGLGRRTLAGLQELGIETLAFADNAKTLQGTEVVGLPVLAPEEAVARYNDRATFVTTIWGAVPRGQSAGRLQRVQRAQLEGLGCRRIASFTALYCKYPETFLPYFAIDLPHQVLGQADAIRRAFHLLDDEVSRREYVGQIRQRLMHDFDALSPAVAEEQYFCDTLFGPADREVFIDCGAFDGDTLHEFLGHWGGHLDRYVALEPDPINFAKLTAYAASLPADVGRRIDTRPVATGARRQKLWIDPTGLASSRVGEGSVEVEVAPLDELLGDLVPTTIKMDVEGAEPDTLHGAHRSIADHSPLLQVCVYHTQDHLWTLPLLIHELNSRYRYHLRPHKDELFDLVCYAVPPGRAAARD
jgi:FkbM family methyltransferase